MILQELKQEREIGGIYCSQIAYWLIGEMTPFGPTIVQGEGQPIILERI